MMIVKRPADYLFADKSDTIAVHVEQNQEQSGRTQGPIQLVEVRESISESDIEVCIPNIGVSYLRYPDKPAGS